MALISLSTGVWNSCTGAPFTRTLGTIVLEPVDTVVVEVSELIDLADVDI
jgi:hypothetical protein